MADVVFHGQLRNFCSNSNGKKKVVLFCHEKAETQWPFNINSIVNLLVCFAHDVSVITQ